MRFNKIILKIKNKFINFFRFLSKRKDKERREICKIQFNPVIKYSIDDLEFEDDEIDLLHYSKNPN